MDSASNLSSKLQLLIGGTAIAGIALVVLLLPNTPQVAAGFSTHEIVWIELILLVSGLMSGLSGFGFSAVGAACLLLIPPTIEVPLLQALSTGNQLLSVGQLREDMPRSFDELIAGPGPCILGGLVGVPIGTWLLHNLPAQRLMMMFGGLLVGYAFYSIVKADGTRLRRFVGPAAGAGVGCIGGLIGGFTAFPGAAVVVWTGLQNLNKKRNRAIVQPYILVLQIFALANNAWSHSEVFGTRMWILLAVTLPVVLSGTLLGVRLYRRISDVNFKRISYFLLGVSGAVLLVKTLSG